MIGLAEVEDKGRDIHEKILESSLTAVDKSMSFINRSVFDETDLKSCAAYKIMLLRRNNTDMKELQAADYYNPKWKTWKAPTLHSIQSSSSFILFNLTDNETWGECSVRYYNIRCTKEGENYTSERMFSWC